jgi:uncharacterized protein
MRIIAFGDIHMNFGAGDQQALWREADLLIVTGDLTHYGHRQDARQVIEKLGAGCQGKLLAVSGNLDHPEVADYLAELNISLHGRGVDINGVGLFGLGGSNPTPFNTPYEFQEEELERLLTAGHRQIRDLPCRILVSHAPPYGTAADRLGNGAHVGSLAVRRFIEQEQPDFCLCGHIHESRGEERLGRTLVLNPGMIRDGGWIGVNTGSGRCEAGLELPATSSFGG